MRKLIQTAIFLLIFLATARVHAVFAQSYTMQLENSGQAIGVGNSFNVNILINTGGQEAINGDVLLTFDPAMVSIDSATTDNFFTYHSATPLGGSDTKYLTSSWEESIAHAKTSSADTSYFTLTLTAKATGSTSLTFDCVNGSEADTNINRASDSKDIVICPLQPLNIDIGSTPSNPTPTLDPNATPTDSPAEPTAVPTTAPTAVPTTVPTTVPQPTDTSTDTSSQAVTELPRAGTIGTTIMVLGVGTLLTIAGFLLIL